MPQKIRVPSPEHAQIAPPLTTERSGSDRAAAHTPNHFTSATLRYILSGGLFVSHTFLGLNAEQYFRLTFEAPKVHDFVTGLIKAGVFGTVISTLACHLGLSVTGGAQGVGVATTRTVVLTIVALMLIDLVFTAAFYYFGW
jgi:ABC-type transporter Mla maintaining outer membrane lipid asymmetry permease subunit MlaE